MSQTLPPTSSSLVAGKYQLVRRIGQGGMGSVWEGRHASLGTRVAIKFIEADYADNGEARSRFDREARAAASIQSKHAIQIFDHGVTEDGKPYIVMEMLTGEPLDKRIQRLGRISLQDTARILTQVGRALGQAHEKGIVHRDLKPENIFIVADEDDELAKVLDFGIAKIQSGADGAPGLTSSTKTGAVLGTPYYMSPEQARGLRNVDHRTDVWSIGVIAYRAVTGNLPFEGESVGDLLVKICTSPIPVPSHALAGLPPAFDAWFARALEREPQRRFSTVAEATEALAYAAGTTVRGRASSLGAPAYAPTSTVSDGSAPPPEHHPSATPHALGSQGTAAPFTANAIDEVVPTTGGSRGLMIGAVAGGLLVVGLLVGGAISYRQRPPAQGGSASAISATTAPAPPPEPHPTASTAPTPTLEPLAPSSQPVAVVPEKPAKPGVVKPGKPEPVKPAVKPEPPKPSAAPPPTPPPTPPPATTKPDHNAAGY